MVDMQLLEDAVYVVFDRRHPEGQALRDLFVSEPMVDQRKDLPLSCGKR
jgi:hypothetical protein